MRNATSQLGLKFCVFFTELEYTFMKDTLPIENIGSEKISLVVQHLGLLEKYSRNQLRFWVFSLCFGVPNIFGGAPNFTENLMVLFTRNVVRVLLPYYWRSTLLLQGWIFQSGCVYGALARRILCESALSLFAYWRFFSCSLVQWAQTWFASCLKLISR